MVILNAVHYKVRENGAVVRKAAYVAMGTYLEGKKDVLGIWLGATESSKYWLNVLTTLKNRGVKGYTDCVSVRAVWLRRSHCCCVSKD